MIMEELQSRDQKEYHDDIDALESAEAIHPSSRRNRASQFLRRTLIAISLGFILFNVLGWLPVSVPRFHLNSCRRSSKGVDDGFSVPSSRRSDTPKTSTGNNKVPLEAHIMSKCPDARDCLRQLVVPVMEQVSDEVDFELSFIASVSNKSTEVVCKHGPTECIGNMLILCAANLPFPPKGHTPTVRSLGFANCLIGSYERIPERSFVEECALEHGIDFDALNECASQQDDEPGDESLSGIALLRKSALHSEALGVKTSCTVRLDEHVWCVRDGGVWKDCAKGGRGSQVSILVEEIKELWKQRN